LGANIRREREAAGLTMTALTARAQLGGHRASSTLSTIESGHVKSPSVWTVYALAHTLGVRMEDLMGVQRIEATTKGRIQERRKLAMLEADLERERAARRVVDEALREALAKLREQGDNVAM
jgi:transcriptional regulator with XRE-family HTH domain